MGKRGGRMRSKVGIAVILFVLVIFIAGCETTKGVGKGVAGGIGATAKGIGKDSYNLWQFIQTSDSWIKKNMW